MNSRNNHEGYPNIVSDMVYIYFLERDSRNSPYASKFAARSLARRFDVGEESTAGALDYLLNQKMIKIEHTTNNLRTYKVNN